MAGRPVSALPLTPLATWLVELIEADGRPLKEIAAVVGVSPSTMTRVRTGETEPDVAMLVRLTRALGVGARAFGVMLYRIYPELYMPDVPD